MKRQPDKSQIEISVSYPAFSFGKNLELNLKIQVSGGGKKYLNDAFGFN